MDRVLQERRHRAVGLEVAGAHRLGVARVADDDRAAALLEVLQVAREAEDRHDLRGDRDVEARLAGHAVDLAAEADDGVAQRAVVHVEHAAERDVALIDAERVAVVEVVVDHRREQVVRGGDRREVAREVEVDVLHRHDLRVAAARRASLDAEARPERRLAQGDDRALAEPVEGLAEADGRGGLSFARRRRRDRGDEHERRLGPALGAGDRGDRHLGLVASVGDEVARIDSGRARHLLHRTQARFLRDFDVGLHRWGILAGLGRRATGGGGLPAAVTPISCGSADPSFATFSATACSA